MLKAREAVRKLKEYHPPLGNREGLRLDFNENTVGCSPRVLEKLRQLDGESLPAIRCVNRLNGLSLRLSGFRRRKCC